MLPRPLRFLGVGMIGLITDLAVFIVAMQHGFGPLTGRLVSLAAATLVTWRLNRALTFDRSGRHPGAEAVRYAAVALTAQAVSYGSFAAVVIGLPSVPPQFALVVGAAIAAAFSYGGQLLFAFRPPAAAVMAPSHSG